MSLKHYYDALDRLAKNKPNILKTGSYKINNDSVAMEAGRKRGSIKAKRYPELTQKIRAASLTYNAKGPSVTQSDLRHRYKALTKKYTDALNREIMLVKRLAELEAELADIKSGVVKFTDYQNKNDVGE